MQKESTKFSYFDFTELETAAHSCDYFVSTDGVETSAGMKRPNREVN